jgi:integrase/recombinase XerD
MLEHYYSRPPILNAKRAQWIGPGLDIYAEWLHRRGASKATARALLQALEGFRRYAERRGVRSLNGLPSLINGYVRHRLRRLGRLNQKDSIARSVAGYARSSAEQFLALNLSGFTRPSRRAGWPLEHLAPGFQPYLRDERGLRAQTIRAYACHLGFFERFLVDEGIANFAFLTPNHVIRFLESSTKRCGPSARRDRGRVVASFLRFLYSRNSIDSDLSRAVPRGRAYRAANMPRAIPWSEVQRVLATVDRRSPIGKRNYAMLQLLATYGLRAQDVARLELKNLDWERGQFRVLSRKAGNSTIYPLAAHVGEAIIDYLKNGRPQLKNPHVFLSGLAPYHSIDFVCASQTAKNALVRAGVKGHRLGSHTFRHSCAQHLVESNVPFKQIGDYLGHRSPSSTLVYAKVAIGKLRQLTGGIAEEAL